MTHNIISKASWLVRRLVIRKKMNNKFRFEDLNVYQESLEFVNSIYLITRKWPKDEVFGLTSQFRRASVSIALNIAEGTSRTRKDFRHFLDLSKGSCFECAAILSISMKRKYIAQSEFDLHYDWVNKLARMISKLKASLRDANNESRITN